MRTWVAFALAAPLALAGCDETASETEPQALADAKAADDSGESSASQPHDDVEGKAKQAEISAFIDDLYSAYSPEGEGVDWSEADSIFEPELAAALTAQIANADAEGGYVDALSADPICGCQDWDNLSHTIEFVTVTGNRGTAKVTITNFGGSSSQNISVVSTPDGWRIHDIGGSFRDQVL